MILFLNASPRKTGVTSTLLRIIAEEARSGGAEVEWVDVNNLSIRPCIGCLKCRLDKKCILPKDDAHRIGELIERCSGLVVGSPTYWGNMTGPLKLLSLTVMFPPLSTTYSMKSVFQDRSTRVRRRQLLPPP